MQRLNAAGRTVTSGWPWNVTLALWPCRSLSARSSSNSAAISVGAGCSPMSPRAKARYASSIAAISSMSFLMASISGPSPSSASSSLNRVRIVRKSCDTPASMVVRCSMARSMRAFISRKAAAARTEVRRLAALAEGLGGIRQPYDRANLVAQKSDRDGQHHKGGSDHPDQENPGIRIVDVGAPGEDAHHRIVQFDADLDDV